MKRFWVIGLVILLSGCTGTASGEQISKHPASQTAITVAAKDISKQLRTEYDKGYRKGFVDGKNSVTTPATTPQTTPTTIPVTMPSTKSGYESDNDVYQFEAGEMLPITSDAGDYELIVEGVRKTKKRNQYSEIKPKIVIFLDFNYKNVSREDGVWIFSSDFNVIDAEGNICDTYPVDDGSRRSKEVPPGVRSKGSEAYAITTDSPYVTVQVLGSSWSSKVIAETQIKIND